MFSLIAKQKRSIIPASTTLPVLNMSTNQLRDTLAEVYDKHFDGHDVTIISQHAWARTRVFSRVSGECQVTSGTIRVWAQKFTWAANPAHAMLQAYYHELGHLYHWLFCNEDFRKRTPYGLELFAERFAGENYHGYNSEYATYLPSYAGYSTGQIYRRTI